MWPAESKSFHGRQRKNRKGKTVASHPMPSGFESWYRQVGGGRSSIASGFLQVLCLFLPQNANICVFENKFISSMSFLCNRGKWIVIKFKHKHLSDIFLWFDSPYEAKPWLWCDHCLCWGFTAQWTAKVMSSRSVTINTVPVRLRPTKRSTST